MADTIREALERLLAVIKPKYTDPDEIVAVVRAMAAARTALAAEPLAPDPREALAARPLLEAVARLGDCIGQHTVGEIKTISDRAAAWLRENPPGQPVAIEPRGCPTPGACSCVEPPAPAEHVATLHVSNFRGYENYDFQHLVDLPPGHYKLFTACTTQPPAPAPAADAEERDHVPGAGNMAPAAYAARLRQCPTHGQLPANAWACPECVRELREELARLRAPAADGEREELAQWLERIGDDYDDIYRSPSALIRPKLARAAALLREARPQPVAAPTPDDFRRWWRETGSDDSGPTPEMLLTANAWASSWAARCAQPIPQPPQGGEVET